MTDSKGKQKSDSCDSIEYLGIMRSKLNVLFGLSNNKEEQTNFDTEQNIREIRALLAINDEIFDRCMANATTTGGKTRLARYGFGTVKTRHLRDSSELELVTQPTRTWENFDTSVLTAPPKGLRDIFQYKYKDAPYSKFVDYNFLFKKSLLLHDDALAMFLPKLKEHLESVQVCLGDLDAWVMQPHKDVSLINDVFGKQLNIPSDIDPHKKSSKCCYCNGLTKRSGEINEPIMWGEPIPWGQAMQQSTNTQSRTAGCSHDMCKEFQVLTTCTVLGKYDTSFDLSQESEHTRLRGFLSYVWGAY